MNTTNISFSELVKAGSYYPAYVFYYSDGTKPRKLHWVDKIELNIVKEYD